MNLAGSDDTSLEAMREAQNLLKQVSWDIRQALYLEGQSISILLDPYPAAQGERIDASVTVLPLRGAPGNVRGMGLVLRRVDDQQTTWYGRLNQRGQLIFRDMDPGAYRIHSLPLPASDLQGDLPAPQLPAAARTAVTLLPLPRLQRALAPAAETRSRRWEHRFRNAQCNMTAVLWERETGELELDFELKERLWDGLIVIFSWTGGTLAEEDQPAAQRLCAPLVWSDRTQACVSQLLLGRIPHTIEIALPDQPILPTALAGESSDVVRESIACSARAQTRRAWQRLLEDYGQLLPDVTARAIQEALSTTRDPF